MGVLSKQLKSHINREKAKKKGLTRYNGSPCKKCGSVLRQVTNYDCVKCNKEKRLKWFKTDAGKLCQFKVRLKYKYGLSKEKYDEMFEKQNGLCGICKSKPTTGRYNKLYVDHRHKDGLIRKLLCHKCNSVLGYVKEDINILKEMIEYILCFK